MILKNSRKRLRMKVQIRPDLSKKLYVISNSFTHCFVCFQAQSDVIFNENHHMVNRK